MDHQLNHPSPRLPPEICDYILDHLQDDHKTLKVCSLVTREWLPRTRKHLFRFVGVINQRLFAFENLVLRSGSGDAVALCVRQLLLISILDKRKCPVPIPASLPRMLASLGRLEELTLRVYMWDECSSSAETITWPVLPMVKALYVEINIMNDVVSLQRFICACPSLSSLKLRIIRIPKGDSSHTHPPTAIPRSIAIETFQCSLREPDPMLRWLLQGGLKLRMRRLAITVRDIPASVNFLRTGDTQALLRASGECLEHLVVKLKTKVFSDSPDGQQAALAHNPNLVSIYVSIVWCLSEDGPFPNSWPSLLSILADIQPTHTKLQSVDITLSEIRESNITSMPLEQLDAALTRIMVAHPRLIFNIWITCDFVEPIPWQTEFIEALLQGLVRVRAGRGRLCLMWLNGCDEIRELDHHTTPSWCRLRW